MIAIDLTGALATFDGEALFAPGLVIAPPSKLLSLDGSVPALTAAGVAAVVVTSATKVSVLDPNAVTGVLADANLTHVEPAAVGRQVASMIFGSVSANPAGIATVTAA